MGVSGCGKSTVGELLSQELNIPFFDGDDFHPKANIEKMSKGIPLNDDDRKPWLEKLATLPDENSNGCVIACSALKKHYRELLSSQQTATFIYLHGEKETLLERINARSANSDHFMPSSLLDSQLDTLESPSGEPNCITLNITSSPQELVSQIITP